jgi:hypothetical protein
MADFTPTLIKEYEVRNAFTPPLNYDDVTKAEILLKIAAVEDYIKATYFNDSMPSIAKGKYPALLIVMSKIIKGNPGLIKKYGIIESFELGDYKVKFQHSGRGDHVSAYESAKSWEQMAEDMLFARGSSTWQLVKAND